MSVRHHPHLSHAELDEREAFTVEACYLMRDRFNGEEIWEHLGLDVNACVEFIRQTEFQKTFQKLLFSRIVPTLKDIGLWGERIQATFVDMEVMDYADLDVEQQSRFSREESTGKTGQRVPIAGCNDDWVIERILY